MRLLVIDSNEGFRKSMAGALAGRGWEVDESHAGEDARAKACDNDYHLIVLGLNARETDGLGLLRLLRSSAVACPVLALGEANCPSQRVDSLEAGADNYLAKSLSADELAAHVRAMLRRPGSASESGGGSDVVRRLGPLTLHRLTRRVRCHDKTVDLPAREFAILEFLMLHPGQVLSHARICQHVWHDPAPPGGMSNCLAVHIADIRRKLAAAGSTAAIGAVRGVGYCLRDPAAAARP